MLERKGMTFGEMAFIDGVARSADVVAIEPSECLSLSREWFEKLETEHPTLQIKILRQLSRQLSARLRQANLEISALKN